MFPPYDIPTGPKLTPLWRFMSTLSFSLLLEGARKPDAARSAWIWWLRFLRGSYGSVALLESGLNQSQYDPTYPEPEQIAELVVAIQVWGAAKPTGAGVSELIKNLGL